MNGRVKDSSITTIISVNICPMIDQDPGGFQVFLEAEWQGEVVFSGPGSLARAVTVHAPMTTVSDPEAPGVRVRVDLSAGTEVVRVVNEGSEPLEHDGLVARRMPA